MGFCFSLFVCLCFLWFFVGFFFFFLGGGWVGGGVFILYFSTRASCVDPMRLAGCSNPSTPSIN